MRRLLLFTAFLITVLLFSSQLTFAQKDSTTTKKDSSTKKKSYFKAALDYVSNAVYSGRKDSAVVSYIKPAIGYVNKAGFSLGAEMSVLANSPAAGRVDEIALEAGYNYDKGNFDGGAYASKYFYSDGSYAVASELEANVGTYFAYNLDFVRLGAGGDALFSTGTDVSLYFNVSHPFEIGPDSSKWAIAPTAQITGGTQSFYRAYYQNRKFSFNTSTGSGSGNSAGHGRGHSSGGTSGTTTKTLTFVTQNQFSVLDYEASVPIEYNHKRWGFHINPVLAIPVNPMTYEIDGVLQKETLTNSFFVDAGVYFRL